MRELLLNEEVEDFIRVRSPSAEDVLPEWLGRAEPLKGFWVCITDNLKDLGPDRRHLVLCGDSEEG